MTLCRRSVSGEPDAAKDSGGYGDTGSYLYEYISGEELMKDIFTTHDILFWIYRCRNGRPGTAGKFHYTEQKMRCLLCNRGDYAHAGYVPGYPYRYLLKQELASKGRGIWRIYSSGRPGGVKGKGFILRQYIE